MPQLFLLSISCSVNNDTPLRGGLFFLSTCFSKETKFLNRLRRHQPTLWKIPLFISTYASLAQLKKPPLPYQRLNGPVPIFPRDPPLPCPSPFPLIVSARAEINLRNVAAVSLSPSFPPFRLILSPSSHTHAYTPTHCLNPYQHVNKMSAQLGLTLARLWSFTSSFTFTPISHGHLFCLQSCSRTQVYDVSLCFNDEMVLAESSTCALWRSSICSFC